VKSRTALLALFALGLFATGSAQAATLTTDRACYAETEKLEVRGTGFTPGAPVTLSLDGAQVLAPTADATGAIGVTGPAPVIDPSRQRRFTLLATDTTNPALTASVSPLATVLDVTVSPTGGRKTRVRKIVARGFTTGKTLYLHVRRRRYKRNIRLGSLKAPCGTKTVRRRVFTRGAPTGVYKLQFDAKRRYSASTLPRVTFTTIVYRTFVRRSSARAAYVPAGWLGLP
jgi:hypothetical protein